MVERHGVTVTVEHGRIAALRPGQTGRTERIPAVRASADTGPRAEAVHQRLQHTGTQIEARIHREPFALGMQRRTSQIPHYAEGKSEILHPTDIVHHRVRGSHLLAELVLAARI